MKTNNTMNKEKDAVKSLIANTVIIPVVLWVGIVVVNETLYEHYMRNNQPFRAFLVRPAYFMRRLLR